MSSTQPLRVAVIPGDGIGPEVIDAALRVLRAVAPEVEIIEEQAGWGTFQATGNALPEATLAAARAADAVLFGAVASPSHPVQGYRSPIVVMRRALDLYANIRPTTSIPSAAEGRPAVDLIVVRENTEDLYSGRERLEDNGDTAIAERVITRRASERIVRAACDLALGRQAAGRQPKVTIVHKANVLRVSDGLFRETALDVSRAYPSLVVEELLVDTAAMHLARSPERFDVIVTTNMFGDILSDIACIHGGGLGLASSTNQGDTQALFEPVHGAAPDIVGKGIANPLAAISCVAMLLEWAAGRPRTEDRGPRIEAAGSVQFAAAAQIVRAAVASVLRDGPHTPDLGGRASTNDVVDACLLTINHRRDYT